MRADKPLMTILLMGGDMQAQGHAQSARQHIFDLGAANLQAATDMARFHHAQIANRLELRSNLYDLVGKDLAAMGCTRSSRSKLAAPVGEASSRSCSRPSRRSSKAPAGQELNGYYRAALGPPQGRRGRRLVTSTQDYPQLSKDMSTRLRRDRHLRSRSAMRDTS